MKPGLLAGSIVNTSFIILCKGRSRVSTRVHVSTRVYYVVYLMTRYLCVCKTFMENKFFTIYELYLQLCAHYRSIPFRDLIILFILTTLFDPPSRNDGGPSTLELGYRIVIRFKIICNFIE